MAEANPATVVSRRTALGALAGLGIGTAVFQRALAAQAEGAAVTPEMIRQAEWIAGIELTDDERSALNKELDNDQKKFQALREAAVGYDVPPALTFYPLPPQTSGGDIDRSAIVSIKGADARRPTSDEELAFLPVTQLAELVRTRQVTSVELTKLYLARLRKYDELLKCVVTFTEETALKQAEQADKEIAAGKYRGPLHGIPWGAKDLIAYPGYKTTWGAGVFQEQTLDVKAAVAERLEEAGAVMVAKLTLGALAWGDEWFGGMTRNPWNPEEGSSGSSAGSASAVVAGLVSFAIGSETLGSIVSPSRQCTASGLRPTFGRVSRYGCMSLCWSMDKLGPICRSVEDCALVLGAIHGYDRRDVASVTRDFHWPPKREVSALRVGYFENGKPREDRREIGVLERLGVTLKAIKLPSKHPIGPLTIILDTESAAVFDPLTRAGIRDGIGKWATTFREGQFVPAIEYLRANRVRTLLIQEMEELFEGLDAYVGGDDLVLTNFTGHPTVVVPDGEREKSTSGQPGTITFTGKLFGESDLLALAHAYQQTTTAHLRRPPLG
jgi:Asp-tRNA(Asn)/Glu-tRNA(Gln) amidotransferase A subunit family amidase